MKRVLMIIYYFPPFAGGGVFRSIKFIKYIRQYSWEPIVLTVEGSSYEQKDYTLFDDLPCGITVIRTRFIDFELLFGIIRKIKLGPLAVLLDRIFGVPDNKLGWLPFARKRVKEILKIYNIDMVYITAPPFSAGFLGLWIKRKYKIPWVIDYRDPWTLNVFFRPISFLHRKINEHLEKKILLNCDWIIANTDGNASKMRRKYSFLKDKISVITNGFDQEDFLGESRYTKNEKFTITYTGSFYWEYSPHWFLMAIKNICEQFPNVASDIRILFVGKEINRKLINNLNPNNGIIEVIGHVSHKESIGYMCKTDVLLLVLPDIEGSDTWLPGKVFEYIACGRPILAIVPNGQAKDLILKTASGVVVHPRDIAAIKESILDLYTKSRLGRLSYREAPQDFLLDYNRSKLTQRLSSIFDRQAGRYDTDAADQRGHSYL